MARYNCPKRSRFQCINFFFLFFSFFWGCFWFFCLILCLLLLVPSSLSKALWLSWGLVDIDNQCWYIYIFNHKIWHSCNAIEGLKCVYICDSGRPILQNILSQHFQLFLKGMARFWDFIVFVTFGLCF